mmetsp:Transcript_5032/g.16056  ORF Transcript_5032/g.16056 Transcript_5032/m.16056 type:complete len:222 (-) Transcript_5032:218-883(-)
MTRSYPMVAKSSSTTSWHMAGTLSVWWRRSMATRTRWWAAKEFSEMSSSSTSTVRPCSDLWRMRLTVPRTSSSESLATPIVMGLARERSRMVSAVSMRCFSTKSDRKLTPRILSYDLPKIFSVLVLTAVMRSSFDSSTTITIPCGIIEPGLFRSLLYASISAREGRHMVSLPVSDCPAAAALNESPELELCGEARGEWLGDELLELCIEPSAAAAAEAAVE